MNDPIPASHEHPDRIQSTQDRRKLHSGLRRGGLLSAMILAVIVLAGSAVRFARSREVKTWTLDNQIPTVSVLTPSPVDTAPSLVLPGTLRSYYDAQMYSRVPGYVKGWYHDIGSHVRKGELLAEIDTPELDQQLAQAQARLDLARSARTLSQITAQRWNALLPLDAVSQQAAQERTEDVAAKTSQVKAAQADLDRLRALKQFSRLVAPFDGIVTARSVDVGALVSGSVANGAPLFTVSKVGQLRLYVQVPQAYSSRIGPGIHCTLAVPEHPDRKFAATLASTSEAINAQSGTLLVELEVDNRNGALKAGDYAQVTLNLARSDRALSIPASALIFRAQGLQVATVNAQNHIAMKPVKIQRDLGARVELASGLTAGERVVNDPPDSILEGDPVRVADAGTIHGS